MPSRRHPCMEVCTVVLPTPARALASQYTRALASQHTRALASLHTHALVSLHTHALASLHTRALASLHARALAREQEHALGMKAACTRSCHSTHGHALCVRTPKHKFAHSHCSECVRTYIEARVLVSAAVAAISVAKAVALAAVLQVRSLILRQLHIGVQQAHLSGGRETTCGHVFVGLKQARRQQ